MAILISYYVIRYQDVKNGAEKNISHFDSDCPGLKGPAKISLSLEFVYSCFMNTVNHLRV